MKKLLYTALLALTLTSCGNEWLEGAKPHDGTADPSLIFVDQASVTNAIVGAITNMRDYYYDRHVTYGLRQFYLGLDFMGNDIVSNPGQWWTYESQWNSSISSATGYQSSFYWAMHYNIINDINSKIEGVEGSETLINDVKTTAIAELKALRSLAYFNLARVFQASYAVAGTSAPCVPIYTTGTTPETTGNDRATVGEVYALIMSDLDYAIENISESRSDLFRVNKGVALAWRAIVNLEMQNWDAAASDASAAIEGYSLMDKNTYQTTGFNTLTGNGEWMWGFLFQADQAHGYASLFSHIDCYRSQNGYKNFFINREFVAEFTDSDMRNLFVDNYPEEEDSNWYKYGSKKFQDNSTACGDYGLMRASELMLVRAEALIRSGQEAAGHEVLFSLQSHRDPSAVISTNTGDALIEELLLERRKELFAETAPEYFDSKRYNRGMTRTGNHYVSHMIEIPAGDPMWLFQIPQTEFDRNPNITTQNQR
ncbi:MAG: RagB/SusD family nutrient uptake outer membrane protein [Rikenellaceae bacterium]